MARMTNGSESHLEATTAIKEILSPKTKFQIGFWNVRTMYMYDTGKQARVIREINNYNLYICLALVNADGWNK